MNVVLHHISPGDIWHYHLHRKILHCIRCLHVQQSAFTVFEERCEELFQECLKRYPHGSYSLNMNIGDVWHSILPKPVAVGASLG